MTVHPWPKPTPKTARPRRYIARGKRPNATNPKRRKSEFARCYGSKDRVAFVRSLPCIICKYTPSENAHIVTGGMRRKANADQIVPLCPLHHHILHGMSRPLFEQTYRLDLGVWAAITELNWLAYQQAAA